MRQLFKSVFILLMSIQVCVSYADGILEAEAKRVTLFGDLLYWNISEQTDSVWANDIGFPRTGLVTYSTPNVKFNWDTGFRGGVAYDIPGFWELKLYWTHFNTKKGINYFAAPLDIITPEFFSGYLSSDTFSSATMNWNIVMNTVDFTVSHPIQMGDSITINPFLGIKEATIDQAINLQLNNTFFNIPIFTATELVTNDFSGVGPSFGIDGKYNFYKNLSFVGSFSTAWMWGLWNVNDTYTRPAALAGFIPSAIINTGMKHSKLGTEMFQYFLGIEWTYQSSFLATFLLGYEMQYWESQLRAPTFQLLPLHGDLTLQGATCGISISL